MNTAIKENKIMYTVASQNFAKIPGMTIAYWLNNFLMFEFPKIENYYESAGRNKTHNNEKYVRLWWEIEDNRRWQPYANGGAFRRWAGNDFDVVDWSETSKDYYESHGGLYNQKFSGKRGVCWNLITSYKNGFRIKHETHHYSSGSPTIIAKTINYDYLILAFLNSVVATAILDIYNPTLNTTVGDVLKLPIAYNNLDVIESLSKLQTQISQEDWDSFETSWNFKKHPLI